MTAPVDCRPVYSAEHRILRVRFVMYVGLLFFAVMQWATFALWPMWSSGLEPNGEPISRLEIFALLAICQLFGWSVLLGLHLYGRSYVVVKYRSRDKATHVYETVGWVGRVRWYVDASAETATRFHAGKSPGIYDAKSGITMLAVDAPFYSERVKGRLIPFIIDDHGIDLSEED